LKQPVFLFFFFKVCFTELQKQDFLEAKCRMLSQQHQSSKELRTQQALWTSEDVNLLGIGPTVHSSSTCLESLYRRTIWLPQLPNFCRTSCTCWPCTEYH